MKKDDLWALDHVRFNNWRSENDIPRLILFLRNRLPCFEEWITENKLSVEDLARITPTGSLLRKGPKLAFLKHTDESGDLTYTTWRSDESVPPHIAEKTSKQGEFEPYFSWARRKLGRARFFVVDKLNHVKSDNLSYGLWHGDGNAFLLKEHAVLFLGGTTLSHRVPIGGKNLDFTSLDGLVITGDGHGPMYTSVAYASCREMKIVDANVYFFRFVESHFSETHFERSKFQDFYFRDCDLDRLFIDRCVLNKIELKNSRATLAIRDSELHEFRYYSGPNTSHIVDARAFRAIRAAHQARGERQEASEAYYRERVSERKIFLSPYPTPRKKLVFNGTLRDLYRLQQIKDVKKFDLLRYGFDVLKSRLAVWLHPKHAARALMRKFKWLMSWIESAMWGYGERPSRLLFVSFAVLLAYTAAYYQLDASSNIKFDKVLDSAYLSALNFTAFGFTDLQPATRISKLITSSEALIGTFLLGLLIAGFSNRNKY